MLTNSSGSRSSRDREIGFGPKKEEKVGKHEKEVQGVKQEYQGAKQEYQGTKQEYQGARQEYDGDKKNRGKAAPAQDLRGYFQVTRLANVLDL